MPAGRPKYTLDDLRSDWKEVVEELYSEGKHDVHVRVALAIGDAPAMSQDLWYRLLDESEEFSLTINAAREKSFAYWMDQGHRGIWAGKQFNSRPWEVIMQNAFGMRNKQDVTSDGKQINLSIAPEAADL